MTETLSDDVASLASQVFTQMLEVDLEPGDPASGDPTGATIDARVHISGVWQGALVIQCARAVATQMAQRLFHCDDPPAADVQDAVGELANVIGGNVKSLVSDHGCFLSVPAVVEGRDYQVRMPGTFILARHPFQAFGSPLVVTLVAADRH